MIPWSRQLTKQLQRFSLNRDAVHARPTYQHTTTTTVTVEQRIARTVTDDKRRNKHSLHCWRVCVFHHISQFTLAVYMAYSADILPCGFGMCGMKCIVWQAFDSVNTRHYGRVWRPSGLASLPIFQRIVLHTVWSSIGQYCCPCPCPCP